MRNPFILAALPAILIGFLNGHYWKKRGYSFGLYLFYGILVSYIFLVKSIHYFMEQ